MDRDGAPIHDDLVWVVSCRSRRSLDSFAKQMLMYQPDLRSYCPHMPHCPFKEDEFHCALYLHGRRPLDRSVTEVLNAANATDAVAARKRRPLRIPHSPHAFVLDENAVNESTSLVAGIPTGKVVFLFVHGFSETYTRIISYLNHLGADPVFHGERSIVRMAFTWPSQSLSYYRARAFAEEAAKYLERAIIFLQKHRNRVVLCAHSLGCRLALHTMTRTSFKEPIEHLLLMGAGVAADSISEKGKFPASKLSCRKITVLFSRRDALLLSNFAVAEIIPGAYRGRLRQATQPLGALGLKGKHHAKVCSVDCTSEVEGHSTHFYLSSELALNHVRASLLETNNKL